MKRILLLMVCALCCGVLEAFKSLSEAQKFAKAFEENEKMETDVQELKDMLGYLVNQRENVGYSGRYVVKITPYPSSQFIIWGPTKGAFRSLVRSLTYLQTKNIIDDNFKIRAPDSYFVFTGDVLNGTPHLLETFILVLSLMKANPATVIYLRGKKEDFLHWQNNGLKAALKNKAGHISAEKIPLGRIVTRFFETLPLALYITGENPEKGLVRISYFSGDNKELEERACRALTSSRMVNVPEMCSLSIVPRAPLTVKAIIKAEDRVMSYKYHEGLTLVEPDRGATAWTVFSAPTTHYRENYQFYYDTFSVIKTTAKLKDFRITLYNRDMRGFDPLFKEVGTYSLLTGQKMVENRVAQKSGPSDAILRAHIEELQGRIKKLAAQIVQYRQALYDLPNQGERL
ncbi:hypothetical protein H0X06_04100 [Candidatus Dependentiae bacterium]|nr:hypothetical protein [Candidatus Dependentiae bacterium]